MSNDWICWSQSATIHSSSYGERGKREKEWSLMPIWFNIRSKYSSSFLVLYRLCSFHRTVYTFHYISFVCSPSSLHIHTHIFVSSLLHICYEFFARIPYGVFYYNIFVFVYSLRFASAGMWRSFKIITLFHSTFHNTSGMMRSVRFVRFRALKMCARFFLIGRIFLWLLFCCCCLVLTLSSPYDRASTHTQYHVSGALNTLHLHQQNQQQQQQQSDVLYFFRPLNIRSTIYWARCVWLRA